MFWGPFIFCEHITREPALRCLLIFVCFVRLYTIDLYNYGYLCIVNYFLFFKVVKRFEIPKVLYKFPIIIILIVQELCESRGGRTGLSVLTSLLASVDVKLY